MAKRKNKVYVWFQLKSFVKNKGKQVVNERLRRDDCVCEGSEEKKAGSTVQATAKRGGRGGQQGRERQGMEKHEGVFQFKGKNHSVVQG